MLVDLPRDAQASDSPAWQPATVAAFRLAAADFLRERERRSNLAFFVLCLIG
jgi:hypothetical protein